MMTFILFIIISFLIIYTNSTSCSASKSLITYTYYNCRKCDYDLGCTRCDDYYYVDKDGYCKPCPDFCSYCFSENVCGKCDNGFVRFRESPYKVLCIMRDDRMNRGHCSMYINVDTKGNTGDFKCVDCEKGYVYNFATNNCEERPLRLYDIDDIIS